jgi:DNA (cytosine-5)-methyltransferase 1
MKNIQIPNHYSAVLSDLDLMMVRSVPPGGNWKNIPESIPSKRLDQIRKSFAAGGGSRSTYYGRLRPDAPSYTINTNFNRPGNGCHIHYDYEGGQHRVISQREAARLQSFPDYFVFYGNRGSVNNQIGNAVPPLVAYQIAKQLGEPGYFVDLFCGAGGLSLGFAWAGWEPVAANDIDGKFLETYKENIHKTVIPGDIQDDTILLDLLSCVEEALSRNRSRRLFVLGGPPCQGFSTAGNRRSMCDNRNRLYEAFGKILSMLNPAGFIFENVPGILNMNRGKVFQMINSELRSKGYKTDIWKLSAEGYAVPQRRKRIFILGLKPITNSISPPTPITAMVSRQGHLAPLSPCFTVKEALDDLPPLQPGEDGSDRDYTKLPSNIYQSFMRGNLSPEALISLLEKDGVHDKC